MWPFRKRKPCIPTSQEMLLSFTAFYSAASSELTKSEVTRQRAMAMTAFITGYEYGLAHKGAYGKVKAPKKA